MEEARERRDAGLSRLTAAAPGVVIRGSDHDARAIEIARSCVMRAGVADVVSLEVADLDDASPPAPHGLVAANAPYGARMGERDEAEAVCRQLGRRLRAAFGGWRAAVLAGDQHQSSQVGLRPVRETVLRNGALDCTLALFDVDDAASRSALPREAARSSMFAAPGAESAADQLANRLRKNLRHIGRTMRRRDVGCYRLYDADLPEYNLAVDVYEDGCTSRSTRRRPR